MYNIMAITMINKTKKEKAAARDARAQYTYI